MPPNRDPNPNGPANPSGDGSAQTRVSEGTISLALGHPALSLLPTELLQRSAEAFFARADPSRLQYGMEQGAGPFRDALAAFLSRTTDLPVAARDLFISAGVSHALDLLCTVLTRPGDLVLVEEPTYFLALNIFADHGLRVRGIRVDDDGLDPDALAATLHEERPVFLYTIPTHQNPTGTTMSGERRRRLVELAQEQDFLILADEVYHLLTYEGSPPAPFGRFADTGRVLALGSFSKILAPGLRMGWIHTGRELMRRITSAAVLDSGGGVAPVTSALVQAALTEGRLEDHVAHLRREYARRRHTLRAALTGLDGPSGPSAPAELQLSRPAGGYFIWATLPNHLPAESLLERAAAAGVSFLPGSRFSVTRGLTHHMRLSFSYYDSDHLAEGARRLLSVVRED